MHLLERRYGAPAVTAHAPDDAPREFARACARSFLRPLVSRRGIRGGHVGMHEESSSFVLDVNYTATDREK